MPPAPQPRAAAANAWWGPFTSLGVIRGSEHLGDAAAGQEGAGVVGRTAVTGQGQAGGLRTDILTVTCPISPCVPLATIGRDPTSWYLDGAQHDSRSRARTAASFFAPLPHGSAGRNTMAAALTSLTMVQETSGSEPLAQLAGEIK